MIQKNLKRFMFYLVGLFFMSVGIALSVKADLGVSPVSCIPYVCSVITGIDMGIWTIVVYMVFIFMQILLLRREYKLINLLQILVSTLFGFYTSLSNSLAGALLPTPGSYPMRIMYLLISMVLIAFGIMLYLRMDIMSLPGEGVYQALSLKTGKPLPVCKTINDIVLVIIAALLSLIFMGELNGVREGTVIAAVGIGPMLKAMSSFQRPVLQPAAAEVSK